MQKNICMHVSLLLLVFSLKAVLFLVTGFVGGIFTALTGNGLDICAFSIMTLVFRINNKVATPTSVIMMACGSVVSVLWRGAIVLGIPDEVRAVV